MQTTNQTRYCATHLAGVQKMVVTGTSVTCSKEALRLTRLYPGTLYCTVGAYAFW